MPDILTLDEAGAYLRMNPEVLRRKVAKGQVPGRKVGKGWRFSRAQLLAWIEAGSIAAPTPTKRPRKPTAKRARPAPTAKPQTGTKVCTDCERTLPLASFRQRIKAGKPYTMGRCRECEAARRRAKRAR